MGFLSEHVAAVRARLEASPLDEARLRDEVARAPSPRNLERTLRGYAEADGVAVIAEVKRASPSAGPIDVDADPRVQAIAYDAAGAAAISVLTEPEHFGGSLEDLRVVRGSVEHPVLRKDFIVHPTQLLEARAAGADSVLLIAACLGDDELVDLIGASRALGMEPLLEAHGDDDLARALATDAAVVGVNARDLESLVVDTEAARARLARVPDDRVAVAESGIATREDVEAVVEAGASAILVGEALMRSEDPGAAIHVLIHGEGTR